MDGLADHFAARGIKPSSWYFQTDRAPSHYKNRFTMQSLFRFKTKSGASTIVWETCAPGHGKGPWDGIGAVVKRLLRQLERFEKLYARGARDVFCALVAHAEEHKQIVGSNVTIADIVYHYVLSANEPALPDMRNVWSAVKRPALHPNVTSVGAIRSSFCFRTCGDNVLAVRELSDRCEHCLAHRWSQCTNAEAGPWRYITMRLTAGSKVAKTRSQRTVISMERVKLARAVAPAEVIALESADDAEGFSFWLALAEGPAFTHTGPKKTENGRSLVPGGYYITVCYYERFPPSSPSTFKLSDTKWTENAEGVISRQVSFSRSQVRRSARAGPSDRNPPKVIILSKDEQTRLHEKPSLDSV